MRSAGGAGADHFVAGDIATVKSTLDLMASASALSDSSGAGVPGDFAGAFQYDIFVPDGTTYALTAGSFVVPEPGTGLMLLLGLGLLAISNREDDAISC